MSADKKPLLGVSTSSEMTLNRPYVKATRYYADSVQRAGGHAVYLPIMPDAESAYETATDIMDRLDGLMLSGGNDDVQAQLYGEVAHPKVTWINPERDRYEFALIQAAMEQQKPILGICRGAQVLNVFMGGTLYQYLPEQFPGSGQHFPAQTEMRHYFHGVTVKRDSRMHQIFGSETIMVNSFHNQAVKDTGEGLVATAWSEEGVIEAFEHASYPFMLGIQAHPEAMTADHAEFIALFKAFVDAAK